MDKIKKSSLTTQIAARKFTRRTAIKRGAAAAALIVGYVGENIGWHYGFGLAGIGMAIGQLTYFWGQIMPRLASMAKISL